MWLYSMLLYTFSHSKHIPGIHSTHACFAPLFRHCYFLLDAATSVYPVITVLVVHSVLCVIINMSSTICCSSPYVLSPACRLDDKVSALAFLNTLLSKTLPKQRSELLQEVCRSNCVSLINRVSEMPALCC